jgi:ribosomal protein S6
MREYELIVVFDLSLSEAEGADAGPKYLENIIKQVNGNLLKIDHWGRRRLAYPIDGKLDADYVLTDRCASRERRLPTPCLWLPMAVSQVREDDERMADDAQRARGAPPCQR